MRSAELKKCDVAAYIWPAYTGDEPRTRIFWPEGIGEWQTVKNAAPKGDYIWDRKPVWGYQNEADSYVMQMQIEAALDHGVNVFIYDWYWYDDRPFLENCLNDGFLRAPNCGDMQFYIMWANHDANTTWDRRNAGRADSTVWQGAVTCEQFEKIGHRWITQYFTRPNYYKIDGKPVVSIYELRNFIVGLGGPAAAKDAIAWLQAEARAAGLPGVHLQHVRWSKHAENLSGVDGGVLHAGPEFLEELGFDSLTHYQFVHFTNIDRDYTEMLPDVEKEWETLAEQFRIPYFPHVSIGWDNNPRFLDFRPGIVTNNTPENFKAALYKAREYADRHDLGLVTVNSWNEWTETNYLEPDNKYGYGYLEAVREVFGGREE